ncbi:MAG: Asp-tRNA(Asn)/Glu-tRNA(Gln) amidotransferase subunit GatA [Desulfovibrionaceae bacterium]|nr:Asp-tRNA(Asn)/Glu-tRNA(Gln) amidotransferase subunit GatA [Desulfovibrionaceae bacterium]
MSELCERSLTAIRDALLAKEVSVREVTLSCLERIQASEKALGALITLDREGALKQADALDAQGPNPDAPLWGIPVTVKDALVTKGLRTSAGSRILENFIPPYDAFVVERLRAAGCVLLGKNNMDEFAMGSTTENSAFHPAHNPWDTERVPGGSSGGSAVSVASCQSFASLGTDTGGSIRQPAALCGCVGLKPTYGRVSRYGVIAYGSSLDQVGPLARSVADCARVLSVIAGHDPRDATSSPRPVPAYTETGASLTGLRIGYPTEFYGEGMDSEVREACMACHKKLEDAHIELVPISLPHTKAAIATYYIIAMAEASSNLARYDGVRYGYRASDCADLMDMYVRSRTEGFGREVKRRIMLGAFVLSSGYYDAYYRKAAQVRRILRDEYLAAFQSCDVILAPVSPKTAWKIGSHADDPLAMYLMDAYTLSLNLAGLPGLSLPVGLGRESGLPVGMQLIGPPFAEDLLFRVGQGLEDLLEPIGMPKAWMSDE